MTERFSTGDVESSERLAFWQRIATETYGEHELAPSGAVAFEGAMLRRTYDDLWVTQLTSTGGTVQAAVSEASRRDPEHMLLGLQDLGTSEHLLEGGERLRLAPGTALLKMCPSGARISFDKVARFIILRVPAARLAPRLGDLQRLLGVPVEARDAALLVGFLRTLIGRDERATEPDWNAAISDVILDLIALAYRRVGSAVTAPAASRAPMAQRWQREMRDFIDRHLDDPELDAALIAHRLGVSPRYVQMLFARMATTVSSYIAERRVEFAAQLLLAGGTSVTEVAFRVGFGGLSHFYRAFRKRFGMSPGRYVSRQRG